MIRRYDLDLYSLLIVVLGEKINLLCINRNFTVCLNIYL